ncbi:cysteine dioxygenase family protein [Paenibacillus hodogayensis]|uniref:Cysteine dioxygenase family protein n=1 Tax=Paenibacillus hodogayensis TaxID=279208 RepID=A0ABV5W3T9_9BACL
MLFMTRLEEALASLRRPDMRDLKETLSAVGCTPRQAEPHVAQPDRLPYGRTVLFRNTEVEAILVHLPARTGTFIHDHGDSLGCAIVVEGELINTVFRTDGRGDAIYASEERVRSGQCLSAPAGLIHRMRNPGAGRTVSLHLYAPPLTGTKTYAEADEYVLDYVI